MVPVAFILALATFQPAEAPRVAIAETRVQVVIEDDAPMTLSEDQVVVLARAVPTEFYVIDEAHTHRYGFGRRTVPAEAIAWGMRSDQGAFACHGLHDRDLGLPTSICFLDPGRDGVFDYSVLGRTAGREREPYTVREFMGFGEIDGGVRYSRALGLEERAQEVVWQFAGVRRRRDGAVDVRFNAGEGLPGERDRLDSGGLFVVTEPDGRQMLHRNDAYRVPANGFPVVLDFIRYSVTLHGVDASGSLTVSFKWAPDHE